MKVDSPFHAAVLAGHMEAVRAFIEQTAARRDGLPRVRGDDEGADALHRDRLAALAGRPDVYRFWRCRMVWGAVRGKKRPL